MATTGSGSRVRVFIDGESADLVSEIKTAERAVSGFDSTTRRSSSNMSRAGKTTDDFSKRTTALGGAFKTAALAAGGAVAAYIGIAQAREAISTTTDLAKTTLGLAGNLDLSTRAASQWAAVAKVRGVEGKALTQAFGTLAKNIELAKDQTSDQAEMLKTLGISQDELKRQKFGGTLLDVSEGMGKLGAGTERTALAMKLFGRGWQPLSPLLREGSDALREQLDLANQYGAAFGGESIKSIEDLIAAERELEFAQLGLQVQFTKEIAPALIKVFLGIAKLAGGFQNARGDITRFVKSVVGSLKEFWQEMGVVREIVTRAIGVIVGIFRGFGRSMKGVITLVSGLLTGNFRRAWDGVKDIFKGGIDVVKSIFSGAVSIFGNIAKRVGEALGNAFSAAWDKIKGIFVGAVNWIIENVLNRIPAVDLPTIGGSGGRETGTGNIPNAAQNRYAGGKITAPMAIVGEEAPTHPEFVLATNPRYRDRNVQLWAQAGHALGMPGFQVGGLLEGLGAGAKAISQAVPGVGASIQQNASHYIDKLSDAPFGGLPGFLAGTADWIKDRMADFIKKAIGSVTSLGGDVSFGKATGLIAIGKALQSAGYLVGEHPAFGGVAPVHTTGSLHYSGRAIDVNWPVAAAEPQMLDKIYPGLARMNPTELLWRVADHFDHLHLGFRKGGILGLRKGGQFGFNKKSSLSIDELTTLAYRVGMPNPSLMAAIAMAESSGRPDAHGPPDGRGLWQVEWPIWGSSLGHIGNPYNAVANAKMAKEILQQQGLGAWVVYNTGAYRQYLGGKVLDRAGGGGAAAGGGGGRGPSAVAGPGGPGARGVGFIPNFGKISGLARRGRERRALRLVERSLGQQGVSKSDQAVLREMKGLLSQLVRNQERIMTLSRRDMSAIQAAIAAAASGQIGQRLSLESQTPAAGALASY